MSKERARRRAEREAERERLAAARAEREARESRRRELRGRITAVLPRTVRTARQTGRLAQRRRTGNRLALGAFILVQVVAWLLLDGWMARLGVLLGSLLLIPVLVTIVFDRRS
ncbi:hypothetical protein Pth03_23690 [Planotetraspora thailandica]|uniref:DUF3040 domain-containing protein n=1 Tax=Planotetraspora thailandica TaxID=487172 RepID=A0A8J3V0H3_9ACTN|nr:hypothetical protein [Planotetraspora thailandica]GII53980.1 hypothetical protein Pth03_23690 [Planotetraspora thailandica]